MSESDKSEDKRYSGALAKAWEEIESRDLSDISALSGGAIKGRTLEIDILDRRSIVDPESKGIIWADGSDMEDDLKVLLLHYLLGAEGKIDDKWASYREFEGGNLYYSVFHGRAIMPLISSFGEDPEGFAKAGEAIGGNKVSRGDVSLNFRFFPFLLINITLWEGDEEVPASANIIFDSATGRILPAEDLAHLSAELVQMIKASRSRIS